jgi:periplasmic protein CpxP/Spy
MKKLSLVAAIALGLLTCVSMANAQGGGGGGGGGKKGGGRGAGMTLTQITNAVTDLKPEQITKVEAALKTQTDALTALRADTTIAPADMTTKRQAITDKFNADMKGILSADQYTKFQAIPAPTRGGGATKGGGKKGGGAPGAAPGA